MYTMKQVSEATGLSYEPLKFYCNRGLVPGLKRDGGNRRVFEQEDVGEIFCLKRLRSCGMSIEEIREFLELCRQGKETVPQRRQMLEQKKQELFQQIEELEKSIAYIDEKQAYYDRVTAGEIEDSCFLAVPKNVSE